MIIIQRSEQMITAPDKVWFGLRDILTPEEKTKMIDSVVMKYKGYVEFNEDLLTDRLRGKLEAYLLRYKR